MILFRKSSAGFDFLELECIRMYLEILFLTNQLFSCSKCFVRTAIYTYAP